MSQVFVCSWSGGGETLARGLEESLTLGRRLAGAFGSELCLTPNPDYS